MTNSNSARRKTCTKKKSYKTPFEAIAAAMDYSREFKLDYHPYEGDYPLDVRVDSDYQNDEWTGCSNSGERNAKC